MSQFVRSYKRRKLFLDQLEVGNSVSFAAAAAGGTSAQFRKWKATDPDFAQDWDDAVESGTDFIEDAATERAIKKSDSLMAMILKARRPEKYDRGSKLELSGGISVEGSKQKLLNKIARLQAEGKLAQSSNQEESQILEADFKVVEPAEEVKALPAGKPQRGSKRRAASGAG